MKVSFTPTVKETTGDPTDVTKPLVLSWPSSTENKLPVLWTAKMTGTVTTPPQFDISDSGRNPDAI